MTRPALPLVSTLLLASLLAYVPAALPAQDAGGTKPPEGGKPPDAKPPDAKPPDAKPPDPKPPENKVPPPSEEEVTGFLKDWDAKIPRMKEEEAVPALKKLGGWYVNPATPEDLRKPILDGVVRATKVKPETIIEEAAKQLGDFGAPAVPHLKVLLNSALDDKVPPTKVVKAGLASLGKIASPKDGDVEFVTDLLKHKDDDVIDKAARALWGYEKSPGKVRHKIFEEYIKACEGTFSASVKNDPSAKRHWNVWGEDMIEGMQKLSRQTGLKKPPEFRKWMNDKNPGGGKNPKTWADEPEKPAEGK